MSPQERCSLGIVWRGCVARTVITIGYTPGERGPLGGATGTRAGAAGKPTYSPSPRLQWHQPRPFSAGLLVTEPTAS